MNTLENFKAELESGMVALSKAMQPVMEKLKQDIGKIKGCPTEAEREYHKRLLALPPNLRSVVCAGIEISLAEKVFAEHGRDLTDDEAFVIRNCIVKIPIFADELQPIKFPEIQVAPKRNGIPWNKKQQFNRPLR